MSFTTLPTVESFGNNDITTLAVAMGVPDTTITVAAVAGFPTDGQFRLLIDNELLLVTGYDSVANQWQVTRGIENTTAATHSMGAQVVCILTKGSLVTLKQNTFGVFIYRDSEPNPTGNVFATFDGAYEAAKALGVPATIVIDDSIAQCSMGNAAGNRASVTAVVGSTATITGLLNMTPAVVGLQLQLSNATSPGNNGVFPITAYLSPSSVQITNAAAVAPDSDNPYIHWFLLDGLGASVASVSTLTFIGNLIPDVGTEGVLTPSMVGQTITLQFSDQPGNSGIFTIAAYTSPSSCWINNPLGVSNDNAGWGFLQGSSASVSAFDGITTATITGLTGMTPENVGQYLNLTGAASPGNNTFAQITAYISATSVQVNNSSAVAPDANNGSISWFDVVGFEAQIVVAQPEATITGLVGMTPEMVGNSLMIQNAQAPTSGSVSGSAATISSFDSGTDLVTLTGLTGILSSFVNSLITITGAATAANNGTFVVVETSGTNQVTYVNSAAVAPDANNPNISWSIPVSTNNSVAAAIVGYVSPTSVMWNNLEAVAPDANNGNLWWYLGTNYDLSLITLAGASSANTGYSAFYIYDGVTWNQGIAGVTNNLTTVTEFSYQAFLGTLGFLGSFPSTLINQLSTLTPDYGGGIFDFSLAPASGDGVTYTLTLDSGGSVSGYWLNMGNNANVNLQVNLYEGALIGSNLVAGAAGGANQNGQVDIGIYATSAFNPPANYPNYYGTRTNDGLFMTYYANASSLVPFAGGGPFPTPNLYGSPTGPYNVDVGTMYYDEGTQAPYWWNGSTWVSNPYEPVWAMVTLSSPQTTGLSTGNPVLVNNAISYSNASGNAGYSSPGRFYISYGGSPYDLNVRLTANIGSLFDGNLTYQWVDVSTFSAGNAAIAAFSSPLATLTVSQVMPSVVGQQVTITGAATPANNGTFPITAWNTPSSIVYNNPSAVAPDANNGSIVYNIQNNVPVGNASGNVGGGTPGDIVALIRSDYNGGAQNPAFFEFQLTYVSGTTFIGENTAGGFILPWATIETLGSPQ